MSTMFKYTFKVELEIWNSSVTDDIVVIVEAVSYEAARVQMKLIVKDINRKLHDYEITKVEEVTK